jgi:hypothetical protein
MNEPEKKKPEDKKTLNPMIALVLKKAIKTKEFLNPLIGKILKKKTI